MKRLTKQELTANIGTLRKANRLSTTPGITAEQVVGILTKCQDSAIIMGEALERYGVAGEQTIHMLEEYCEALYLQSRHIGNAELQKELQNGIASMLDLIEHKLQELPADKKVAVFLPYKASMWDSLESVWKAADEDPDCDAYVVPIPYFDKNPDLSLGEMHYEGDQYPSYVPVYSWEEFSIPNMKPDVVFIHNPYDEYNYVVSVHPAFYTTELKKYTKKLVYIPYFVLGEIDPNTPMTKEQLKKMESFCLQPGVINTDKVIVQSEAMKQVYVNILVKNYGEETRAQWEERILGLGSPKLDKVNSTSGEDFEVPEEWKPVLYREDGSKRKVVLYNTSVTELLQHEEKMLIKMRNVFQTFYENRDEVALLWRPHPLIKATIESMRPKLWEEYKKLVNEYCSASWGIYDDTAELNRAIGLADAYYGDGSSLVKLCQEKGISVMVQDVTEERILWEDIKPNIQAYPELLEMVRVGEYLYGFARECNALLRVDLEDGNVNYVDSVVQETENEILFHNTKEYNGYVVFSPYNATKVGVYDTRMNEFIFFNEQNAVNKNKAKKVGQSVVHNNTIHFLPLFAKDMLSVDMENRSVRTSDWLYRAYSHYTGNGEESFNRCSVYQHENCVFAAIMGTNYIMEILFNTESCIFYQLDEKVIQLMGYGNNIYMVTKDKKVIQWSIAEKKMKKLWKTDLKKNEFSEYLLGSIIIGNVVYFLRQGITGSIGKRDFGIKIDTKQEQVSVISVKEEFGIETEGNEQYSFFNMDKEGNVYFISSHRNMQIYNIHTHNVKKLSLKYSEELGLKNILKRTERYIGKECWLAIGETVM